MKIVLSFDCTEDQEQQIQNTIEGQAAQLADSLDIEWDSTVLFLDT